MEIYINRFCPTKEDYLRVIQARIEGKVNGELPNDDFHGKWSSEYVFSQLLSPGICNGSLQGIKKDILKSVQKVASEGKQIDANLAIDLIKFFEKTKEKEKLSNLNR